MLTLEILIIVFAAIYFAATVYSLISQNKPTNALSIPDLTSSINSKGGGWIILIPVVALVALLYNFIVTSFWFLGVVFHFIAWLLKWVWNEVIVAGGYFIFSILWHYLIKWPWKLLLLSFGKILSSMKLNYLFVGTLAIFSSLVIMFLGRFLQMLLDSGSWITYLFAVLAIIPIGVGVSWIIQLLKGKSKEDAKQGSKKYVTHLSYIILALLAIFIIQGGLVYLGTLTSFSSIFSTLLAGGNLLGSFLILVNSIVIIFSLGALPSFSDQYQGENKDVISSFFKYLINHNWAKYVIAAPAMLIPVIIACIIPYFLTQGISYMAGEVSNEVFETRLADLRKTQDKLPAYNYSNWLDVKATSDDSLKVWKSNDLKRVRASLGIINTESTKIYLDAFYKAHASEYAAAPVGALFYLFNQFYAVENKVVSTAPFSPVAASIDTATLNDMKSKTIPQIQESIKSLDEKILELNQALSAVCDSSRSNAGSNTNPDAQPQQPQTPTADNQNNMDRCDAERAYINNQISDATKSKALADKSLIRANEVATHLAEVFKLEKSSNTNSAGASKIAYLLISLWLCLLIGLAFSPIIPLFAQVNHSIFTEDDNAELFVMERIRSASAINPNQPLLGTSLFVLLLIAQPIVSIPGLNMFKSFIPSLPKLESVLSSKAFSSNEAEEETSVEPSVTAEVADTTSMVAVDTAMAVNQDATAEAVLSMSEVDEKPSYTGDSFSYNDNLHIENGAPDGTYEVVASFVVEIDGSVSEINTSTSNGYSLEDEIINSINRTSGQWSPAQKNGVAVRCRMEGTFSFPSEK